MATREDSFFKDNEEAFQLIDKQYAINMRIQNATKQINEIEQTLREGPDALHKLKMNISYDQEQHTANRKRLVELLSSAKSKITPQ